MTATGLRAFLVSGEQAMGDGGGDFGVGALCGAHLGGEPVSDQSVCLCGGVSGWYCTYENDDSDSIGDYVEKYCTCDTPEQVANKDAAYVLSYAIILLNTDQHNPTIKANKRMTVEDFSRNLRGVNDGKNFSPEYLRDIYESIK